MSSFFSFGVNLANKLNFKKKFSILALATLLPLSLGAAYLIQLQYQQITTVKHELSGLAFVQQLSGVDKQVSLVRLSLIQPGEPAINQLGGALTEQVEQVSRDADLYREVTPQSVRLINQELLSFSQKFVVSQAGKESLLNQINALSDRVQDLKEDIGAESGLSLDDEPSGFYLAELYLSRLSSISDFSDRVVAVSTQVLINQGLLKRPTLS